MEVAQRCEAPVGIRHSAAPPGSVTRSLHMEAATGNRSALLNPETPNVMQPRQKADAVYSTSESSTSRTRRWKAQPATSSPTPTSPPLQRLKEFCHPTGPCHYHPLTLSRLSATHPPALRSAPGRSCHPQATAHGTPPERQRRAYARVFTTATQATRNTVNTGSNRIWRVSCSAGPGSATRVCPALAMETLTDAPCPAGVTPAVQPCQPASRAGGLLHYPG